MQRTDAFQTFEAPAAATATASRLAAVRRGLQRRKLQAWLVPRADEHQGEYVPPSAERLAWISGFTGSAGMAVITTRKAALFVDGRYVLQAPAQVDTAAFEILQTPDARVSGWLISHLRKEASVGFDPWLHTIAETEMRRAELAAAGIALRPQARSLLDQAWQDRPSPPAAPIVVQPVELSGRAAADKIADLQTRLAAAGETHALLTLPDSICWLLNIRGGDVAHNPVVLAFALVPAKGKVELFVAPAKVTREARAHLARLAVLPARDETAGAIAQLSRRLAALRRQPAKVRVDPATAPYAVLLRLGARRLSRGKDTCIEAKAIKTTVEITGARNAHLRDGVAMVRFLSWLDAAAGRGGSVDEIAAVRRLEACRRDTGALEEISFDTISGSGPNGAIVHYRVSERTNRKLAAGELFLVDSGGQYRDGTTDITRTLAIGRPSAEMRSRYTLVLKGHLAIAAARFPKGTRGVELDPLARHALWQAGLDFDHGTGHGVGSYLSVHEGPQSISRRGMVVLEPGMIVSNEPGYYKAGHYGIRIENLVLVTPAAAIDGGERAMLGFETLTLCPYDRRLIDAALLTAAEVSQIDAYHERVRKALSRQLAAGDREWLAAATAPLAATSR